MHMIYFKNDLYSLSSNTSENMQIERLYLVSETSEVLTIQVNINKNKFYCNQNRVNQVKKNFTLYKLIILFLKSFFISLNARNQ